jgi:hypothetical protein
VPDEQAADYPRGARLPDDAVLVRGAPLVFRRLRRDARLPFKRGKGFYGLSVFSFPGVSDPTETFRLCPLKHPEIGWVTTGEVREAGMDVKRTFRERGHCSIIFPAEPSDEDIETVMQLLEPVYTIGDE